MKIYERFAVEYSERLGWLVNITIDRAFMFSTFAQITIRMFNNEYDDEVMQTNMK